MEFLTSVRSLQSKPWNPNREAFPGEAKFITSRSSHALYPAESSPRPSDGPLTTENLQSRDLLRAIFEARNAMCSNPRDKVFAHLGLAARDPLSSKNHPNYTTSDVKVYERLASTYAESKKNLNILSCCNRVAVPRGFLDGMSAYSTHSSTDTSVSRPQYTMQLARSYRSIYIPPGVLSLAGFHVTTVKYSEELKRSAIYPESVLESWHYIAQHGNLPLARFFITLSAN